MFAQSSSVARRAQQSLSFLRRLITCTGHGEIGSFYSQNLQKSPLFSSENSWDFSSNNGIPSELLPLHLPMGFRYFSADPQNSSEYHGEDFLGLDSEEINEGTGFKRGTDVEILSRTGYERLQTKTVSLLFKEAIGLEKRSESKRLELELKGLRDLPPEEQVKELKSKLEFQWEMMNTLRDSIDDLHNTVKELNIKNELLENAIEQITQSSLEFNRNSIGKSTSYSEEMPHPKRKVKFEQKMPIMKKKPEGSSGSLEHPWPEWVQFVEHLNEKGYLSKEVKFADGPVDLQGLRTREIYGFIKLAAFCYVKDHDEILKLSGSDLKKVALHCCPSVEKRVVFAAKRLHSFYSTENDVSKVKKIELEEVVRLLCAYGLNAEKGEPPIPDDIKQSAVNLLKELVDISASSMNDG